MARILIIDNSDHATSHFRRLLKDKEQHEVSTARTLEIALGLLEKREPPYHAIFIDSAFGLDGLKLIRRRTRARNAYIYGSWVPTNDKDPNSIWAKSRSIFICPKEYRDNEAEPVWSPTADILNQLDKMK